MNYTKTPTSEKKVFPLRLPQNTYKEIRLVVRKEQDKGNYAYSINDFLTQIIEDKLKELQKNE